MTNQQLEEALLGFNAGPGAVAPAEPSRARPATQRFPRARRARLSVLRSRQAESDALAEVNTRERNYRRGLAVADMVAAGGAMIAAFLLIGQDQLRPSYLLVMPLIVLVSKIQGLYDHDDLVMTRSTVDELPKLANLATLFALLLFLSRHLIISGTPGGRDVVAVWVLLIVFLAVSRYIARAIAAAVSPVERCAVLGDLGVYRRLQSKVGNRRGLALVCAVPLDEVLSGEVTVEDLARDQQVHRLIIAPTETVSGDDTIDVVRAAKATGLRVSLLPSVLGAVGGSVALDNLGGITLLGVPRFGLSRSSAACKRAFDLVSVTLLLSPRLRCSPSARCSSSSTRRGQSCSARSGWVATASTSASSSCAPCFTAPTR